jgi:hypothetical protein
MGRGLNVLRVTARESLLNGVHVQRVRAAPAAEPDD